MSKELEAEAPRLSALKVQVTKVLGTGPGRTVMLIMDKGTGRQYALKVIKREGPDDDVAIERARAEAEASAKLGHPAILKAFDFRTRRSWFRVARAELLMEYVEGKGLDALERLEVGPAVLVFAKVASALAHMHRRGVIHGGLRPSKVLLSRNGQVRVRGYGLSQVAERVKPLVKPLASFAAPEQAKEKVVDERIDLYGLGATLYRALTGRPPGRGEGQKISTPVALNPAVPGPLNELVIACLQSNPHRRPADMYEVVKQLEGMAKEMRLEEAELRGLAAEQA
jgi:eukaryotic-like serine/threonine-protein kinase